MFGLAGDLWTKGTEAWLAAIGADQVITATEPAVMATESPADRGPDLFKPASGAMADLGPVISQAWSSTLASTLRYWRTLAELQARYQPTLAQLAVDSWSGQPAVRGSGGRVLADELRAYLREIGDAATLEARRLQAELEVVGEQVARAADAATPTESGSDPQARRHRVKP